MIEPVYLAQTAEKMDDMKRIDWWNARSREATATKGCAFFRPSHDPDKDLTLLEGWTERPDEEGTPRWQLARG